MTNDNNDQKMARDIALKYIEGSRTGNVETLKSIFHPKALMSGYLNGQLEISSPEPFFEATANVSHSGGIETGYSAEISSVEVTGNIACVTIVESGFLGMDFVNYFHLIKADGIWTIIAKTYQQK